MWLLLVGLVCVVCAWEERKRGATWLLLVGHADVRTPAKRLQVFG